MIDSDSPTMTKSEVKSEREKELPPLDHIDWNEVSVVKGRLRKVIQDKRAMNGKDALCLDFILDSPIKNKNLPPEEVMHIQRRAHIRKERNRLAAQRMRERRKSYCDKLVKELETLEDSNSKLVWEIRNLEVEKNKLESILNTHLKHCEKAQPVTDKTVDTTHQPSQPLDLRTPSRICDAPEPEVNNSPASQSLAEPQVREQEAPLDLRVLKRHCSVIDYSESSPSRRQRLSSI